MMPLGGVRAPRRVSETWKDPVKGKGKARGTRETYDMAHTMGTGHLG
jgi:hypothetical protein